MTLNQLVCRAASVYPEARVLKHWDLEKEEPADDSGGGDTLAGFVARELHGTFDPEAGDGEQLAAAVKAMQSAADKLGAVAHAFADIDRERTAA